MQSALDAIKALILFEIIPDYMDRWLMRTRIFQI